jgi:lipopolysaccharide export system permease protein
VAGVGALMITLLDRYIANRLILSISLVFGVLFALLVFFLVIDSLPDYGRADFDAYQLARYVMLSQPRRLYEVFPVVILIGTLLGLSALAANAELVAMRAAGVSVAQIVGSAMKVGFVFALATVALGEYGVPVAENQAQLGRAQALAQGLQKKGSGLWLRDQNSFVNIAEVLPDLSLRHVSIYSFDNGIDLRAQTRAERAVYGEGGWRLEQVRESLIDRRGVTVSQQASRPWQTTLSQDVVGVFTVRPEGLSIQHLVRYIDHLRQNGQSTERYRLVLWQKSLMPVSVLVMVLLATPFTFGQIRAGGLSRRIFAGVMIGLGFVLVTRLFGHFGLLYGLPPFFGAVLPILMFFGAALLLLQRAR